jgi:tRNA threonylcarbamoyl adenosine modification protein YjeE
MNLPQALDLADDAATARLGAALAALLRPGDLVLLQGGLGAGKTALARAVIRTLAGDPALEVPSPSFALVQPYATPRGPVVHADLYRLAAAADVAELGLMDDADAITLVEWPERAPRLASLATAGVTLEIPADGRGRRAAIAFADDRLLPLG